MILIILMSNIQSCEVDLSGTVRQEESKIWVKAIVGVNDVVKIYVGNTSGLNSDDKAEYRDDAIVKLKVNSGSYQKLNYKIDPKSSYKGYYFSNRLENAFEGDTLCFIAWIPGSEFDTVKGKTYIPEIPNINAPEIKPTIVNGDFLVDFEMNLTYHW